MLLIHLIKNIEKAPVKVQLAIYGGLFIAAIAVLVVMKEKGLI